MKFEFIDNVPEGIRPLVQGVVGEWVEQGLYPVLGYKLPNGVEVDFCRRPWPPEHGVTPTVGSERDWDEERILEFLNG